MLIRIGYDIRFSMAAPVPMLFLLNVHPCRAADLLAGETVRTEPPVSVQHFADSFGNRCGRVVAPAGTFRLYNSAIVRDSGLPDVVARDAPQHPVEQLPPEVLQFLLPSRYCQVDSELSDIAWKLFGLAPPGWPRVQAVCDWVHNHVTFGYEHADATRTALDVYRQGRGVCRDFMHLSVTFCRCLNIPARYVTGYLGDIGVPAVPLPMDFSAWFEVYLGKKWYAFDARHNMPRIGRVLMAVGRDAVDVALTTSFGQATLEKFQVTTEEITNV